MEKTQDTEELLEQYSTKGKSRAIFQQKENAPKITHEKNIDLKIVCKGKWAYTACIKKILTTIAGKI